MKDVSIIIPTIGRINYLDIAIESLLNQTISFGEIVVFDNSEKQNIQMLSKFGNDVRILWKKSNKFLDPISSWNMAVRCTSSEYVTLFGDDDIACNDFHERVQECLRESDFVYMNCDFIDENENIIRINNKQKAKYTSDTFRYLRMTGKLQLFIPGAVFKRNIFEIVGGYKDSKVSNFLFSDDLLYFKIASISRYVVFSGKSVWKYRIHEGQIGKAGRMKNFPKTLNFYCNILENDLEKLGISLNRVYPNELTRKKYIFRLTTNRMLKNALDALKSNKKIRFYLNLKDIIDDSSLSSINKVTVLIRLCVQIIQSTDWIKYFNQSLVLNDDRYEVIEKNQQKINYEFTLKFNKLLYQCEQWEKMQCSFALYGFGSIGKILADRLKSNISVIIDQNKNLTRFENIDIIRAYDLPDHNSFDYIIITVLGREAEIKQYLEKELNIKSYKIITIDLS